VLLIFSTQSFSSCAKKAKIYYLIYLFIFIGGIVLSRQDVENLQDATNIDDNLQSSTNEAAGEFDIKVETTSTLQTSVENDVSDGENENEDTNFSINQSVLNNPDDQQISFSNSENITQFQVQLSISDIQNLQKITNENVLMSQAALPEERTKHTFLSQSPQIEEDDDAEPKNVDNDEEKQFLSADNSFTTDDHNNLFIKNEVGAVGHESNDVNTRQQILVKSEKPTLGHKLNSASNNESSSLPSIVYVQVQNSQTQLVALAPQAIQQVDLNQQPTPCDKSSDISEEGNLKKKADMKDKPTKLIAIASKDSSESSGKSSSVLRTLAPRLLSCPLYAGAQASIGVGKTLLKPYHYGSNTVPLIETGQYFEVLGRCTLCFRFSRTTSYCRSEKNHREPKSAVCSECDTAGVSTVVCRRKLNHTAPNSQPLNIVINTALQNLDHIKQLCVRNYLPPCFAELHSIVVHHADIIFSAARNKNEDELGQPFLLPTTRKPINYARGYLYPYLKEKWEEWLKKFCHQTGTNYRVRTGKRVNKKTDHHGLANHNGSVVLYRTLETQLYNCALGGKPRKRKQQEGTRKRKERGSKLIGCPAAIYTRLIETKSGWKALEITVPKVLAHLPFHDPRQTPDSETLADLNEVVETQVNTQQLQQPALSMQTATDSFDFVSDVADSSNMSNLQAKETTPAEIRKNTKHLLLTCASLVDTIENADVMAAVQVQTHELLNKLLQEVELQKSPVLKKKKKRSLECNSLMNLLEINSQL